MFRVDFSLTSKIIHILSNSHTFHRIKKILYKCAFLDGTFVYKVTFYITEAKLACR